MDLKSTFLIFIIFFFVIIFSFIIGILVIIFFGGVFEILPEQVMTIVPAILFIWETCELFFNKNALAGYKLWIKKKTTRNK